VVRGRILRQDGRGFVLATDEGETSFFPAKIGPDGRPQPNLAVRSVVGPYLGDLCFARSANADLADEAMSLRIIEGFIEFDGARVARLLPGLRLSLLDRLTEVFDAVDEDAAYIAELEERLAAQSEAREAAPAGAGK
jgi:hypothetical protein